MSDSQTTHRYDRKSRRLYVYGENAEEDFAIVKGLIKSGQVKPDLDAIIYQGAHNSALSFIMRGKYLENFLSAEDPIDNNVGKNPTGFKEVLRQVNESSVLEAAYIGVIVYCISTKKFLLALPQNMEKLISIGDHPKTPTETHSEILCRLGREYGLSITPETINNILKLRVIDLSPTTYYHYMLFVQDEFSPSYPADIKSMRWTHISPKLPLHPVYKELFTTDETVQQFLIHDIDFNTIIEGILDDGDDDPDSDPDPIVA
jgi:hypothetical protein